MPTYGWVHEDAEERHHERVPLPLPLPAPIVCPECHRQVGDQAALARHLGADHPLGSPRLLLEGRIVIGERVLVRPVAGDSVLVANTSEIHVREDGRARGLWTVDDLRSSLASKRAGVLEIALTNARSSDGASATERLRLRVDVADPGAMDKVDAAFAEIIAVDEFDSPELERFASAADAISGAARYASALHQYGVALLVKDRVRGAGKAQRFAEHREKLLASLGTLRYFPERPIAKAVCGFIRFNVNDLESNRASTGVPELDRAFSALRAFVGIIDGAPPDEGDERAGSCPTDRTTGILLESCDRPEAPQILLREAESASLAPDDRTKCRVLALRALPAASGMAQELAQQLASDPVFSVGAATYLREAHG